jgi:hypothetical protein
MVTLGLRLLLPVSVGPQEDRLRLFFWKVAPFVFDGLHVSGADFSQPWLVLL